MSDPTNVVVLKCEFWIRVSVAVKVCLKEALLEILHDPAIGGLTRNNHQLHALLKNFKVREEKNLKGVIKPFQWDALCHTCSGNCPVPCPRHQQTNSQNLDITCIVVLIINLTNLPAPLGNKGWRQALPQIGDATKAAFVLLARQLRNDLIHCSLLQLCSQQDFDDFWQRTEDILLGLGYKNIVLFNDMKTIPLHPYIQQQIDTLQDKCLQLTFKKCNKADLKFLQAEVDVLKQTASELEANLRQNVNKTEMGVLRKIQQDCTKTLKTVEADIAESRQDIADNRQKIYQNRRDQQGTINLAQNCNQKVDECIKEIEELKERIDPNINPDQDCHQKVSDDLKEQTKRKYGQVNVPFAPKISSLSCCKDNVVDRDDIIVDLSLITDCSSVCNVAATQTTTTDVQNIPEIRENLKQNAESVINYRDIVKSTDDYVVISGVPGCGKTTLVETLLFKWSSGKLWNTAEVNFDFVFVVFLRNLVRFKNCTDITAEQILAFFYPGYDFSQYLFLKDKKSLLILEGFDELSGKEDLRLNERDFTSYTQAIYDLLDPNNARLPFTRIVTSRPGSCSIILDTVLSKPCCNRRVFEVTGFSSTNITLYIQKHFPEENQALSKLGDTSIVRDMMVIPFYCWGVCHLIKNQVPVEEFAQTYTALYVNLLVLFIRNHGLRNPSRKLSEITQDKEFKETCLGLAELAFKLEESGNINFTEKDLPKENEMEKLVLSSGMLVKIEGDNFTDPTTTYQFLHYTFHEFLVALHTFSKGQPFNKSKNIQIVSMLAGLIGGSLDLSESNRAVQIFSKTFTTRNNKLEMGDIIRTFDTGIKLEQLSSIVYEFHNTLNTNVEFIVNCLCNQAFYTPYLRQCEKFLKTLHAEKRIRFGTVNYQISSLLDNALLPLLMNNNKCSQIITNDNKLQRDLLTSNGNLQCHRIILSTISKRRLLALYAQHTTVLEFNMVGGNEELFEILLELNRDSKEIWANKKIVVHCRYFFDELDVDRLLSHIDFCQHIVIGFRRDFYRGLRHHPCHYEDCVEASIWESVSKSQCALAELLSKTKFNILKSVKIGASCMNGGLSNTSTVVFSRSEIITGKRYNYGHNFYTNLY